jgi:hypothetical protein
MLKFIFEQDYNDNKCSDNIYVQSNDEFWQVLDNTNLSFRGSASDNPMSDWGHAMFTDDSNRAYFPDTIDNLKQNNIHAYFVNRQDLTEFSDIENILYDTWCEDIQDGTIYNYDLSEAQVSITKDELFELFNPTDIVDEALAYDSREFLDWFVDRFIDVHNISGIKTNDGAVVFDADIIHEIIPNI